MTLRRDLLTFAAGAVATGAVLPATASAEGITDTVIPSLVVTHPDAELIAACAAFDAWERRYLATNFKAEPGTPEALNATAEQEECAAAQEALVDRMCELRAATLEGMAARARSLALFDFDLMSGGTGGLNGLLMAAIVRDLLSDA